MSIAALDVLLAPASDAPHPPLTEAEVHRALDLAQQGFVPSEIGELLDVYPDSVETAIEDAVPGGSAVIAAALRRRLRAWRRDHEDSAWWEAEAVFGIPHAHVLRLVRVPRDQELGVVAPGEPGYLDTVLAGTGCKDIRASRSARLYAFGATLQEIGDLFGVTRERIRQILSRDTPWSSTDLSAAAKVLARARRSEHADAAEHWSLAHPAAPLDEAVGARPLRRADASALGRRRSRHEPAFETPRETARRTEEEIVADLRAFHTETGKTTCQAFTAWAREHDVPGHQTAAIRFGTWNEALKAAGIGTDKGAPRSSFSDEDLWAAVLSAVQAPDGGTTFRAVEESPGILPPVRHSSGVGCAVWRQLDRDRRPPSPCSTPRGFRPAWSRSPLRATGRHRRRATLSTTCARRSMLSARGSRPPGTPLPPRRGAPDGDPAAPHREALVRAADRGRRHPQCIEDQEPQSRRGEGVHDSFPCRAPRRQHSRLRHLVERERGPVSLDRRRPLRFLERCGRGMSALRKASLHAL